MFAAISSVVDVGSRISRKRRLPGFSPVLAALLICGASASGQAPDASLFGRLAEATGRPVHGAKIVATHVDTGIERSTTSDAQGQYALESILRGMYTLEVQ